MACHDFIPRVIQFLSSRTARSDVTVRSTHVFFITLRKNGGAVDENVVFSRVFVRAPYGFACFFVVFAYQNQPRPSPMCWRDLTPLENDRMENHGSFTPPYQLQPPIGAFRNLAENQTVESYHLPPPFSTNQGPRKARRARGPQNILK